MKKLFRIYSFSVAFFAIFLMSACSSDEFESNLDPTSSLETLESRSVGTISPYNWLKHIKDDTYISNITIPGTHDSGAILDNCFTQCQSKTIYTQLDMGIRFLDIRCRHIDNRFTIHHGPFYQGKNFDSVLEQCRDFLQRNPTEFIIMSIKEEYNSSNTSRSFYDTFAYYKKAYGDLIYNARIQHMPKLKDVRGKIVILSRFSSDETTLIANVGWTDKTPGKYLIIPGSDLDYKIYVQDNYEYDTFYGKTHKWNNISAVLNYSKINNNNTLFLNFTSATGLEQANLINTPLHVAKDILPLVYNYLQKNPVGHYGTIIMDFPSPVMVSAVYMKNNF